ncbi:hypothetical protein HJG60_008292 [Phyllostomus discolor]|uniref:Uncharacterized protein n=1 Tax=Phyllostomus discolor TaxID=89673 RepID=A0A833Z445_9CHIR|nr:hypothetical protein HJG60_008292 [Phyllostomus discolor]
MDTAGQDPPHLCVPSKFSPALCEFKTGRKRPFIKNMTLGPLFLNDSNATQLLLLWQMDNECVFSLPSSSLPSKAPKQRGQVGPCSCPNVPLCRGPHFASNSPGLISASGASAALCSTLRTCCLY